MRISDMFRRGREQSPTGVEQARQNPLAVMRRSGFVFGDWYRSTYKIDPGIQMPLDEHYLFVGARQGFEPNELFQSAWYRRCYPNVVESGLNLALHYLTIGSQSGLKPNPIFDPAWYRMTYPDVAASGVEPLVHFLRFGAREGRLPAPDIHMHLLPKAIDPVTGLDANPLTVYLGVVERIRRCSATEPRPKVEPTQV